MSPQEMVHEFALKTGENPPASPNPSNDSTLHLRAKLILEEAFETIYGMGLYVAVRGPEVSAESIIDVRKLDVRGRVPCDLVETADGLADLLYVTYGTAVSLGIDIQPIFEEVHRSNMTKFIDGHRREDGKWIKGPSYTPADVEGALCKQIIASE